MKRRNILTLIGAGLTSLSSGLFLRKKDVQRSLIIPQSVTDEILEILTKGGQITGYTYSLPPDKSKKGILANGSFGRRYFTEEEEKKWQITHS